MALRDGLDISIGSQHSSQIPTIPWPFPSENPNSTSPILLVASPGDRLSLNLRLNNFQWHDADKLLIMVSEAEEKSPAVSLVGKQMLEKNNGMISIRRFNCYQRFQNVWQGIEFEFRLFSPCQDRVTVNHVGRQWRQYGQFHVKLFRLQGQATSCGGRTTKEFTNIRYGPSSNCSTRPPARDQAVRDLFLERNVVRSIPDRTQNVLRYMQIDVPQGKLLDRVFFFRTPGWERAYTTSKNVEECRLGTITRGLHGQFSVPVTNPSSAASVMPRGRSPDLQVLSEERVAYQQDRHHGRDPSVYVVESQIPNKRQKLSDQAGPAGMAPCLNRHGDTEPQVHPVLVHENPGTTHATRVDPGDAVIDLDHASAPSSTCTVSNNPSHSVKVVTPQHQQQTCATVETTKGAAVQIPSSEPPHAATSSNPGVATSSFPNEENQRTSTRTAKMPPAPVPISNSGIQVPRRVAQQNSSVVTPACGDLAVPVPETSPKAPAPTMGRAITEKATPMVLASSIQSHIKRLDTLRDALSKLPPKNNVRQHVLSERLEEVDSQLTIALLDLTEKAIDSAETELRSAQLWAPPREDRGTE